MGSKIEKTYAAYYESPVGLMKISVGDLGIRAISFIDGDKPTIAADRHELLTECGKELKEYFAGKRKSFDLPLAPEGTKFQRAVWQALTDIPFGETTSYGQIAAALDNPKAVRAVGGANGKNPIVIIVPCHRVIGSDGTLTGYGSGIWRKEWLLRHESAEGWRL